MKLATIAALAIALTACGGGGDDTVPLDQCNGTPKSAIVYAGPGPFPELAATPNACVFTTADTTVEGLRAVVMQAKASTARPWVSLIGVGDSPALAFMAAYPGHVDMASLWHLDSLASTDTSKLRNSLASIYLNAGPDAAQCLAAAERIRSQMMFATCNQWPTPEFDAAQRTEAIRQLRLDLLR
jgi:hypothetical protein